MAHCFAFPEVFTTQEPVTLSLLCSESIPFPGVVEAAAVVVANEGNTVGDELPTRSPPTIEPCPGSAWLGATACAVKGSVEADEVELGAVRAAAKPAESVTNKIVSAISAARRDFIA